jgi:hypothetical protein
MARVLTNFSGFAFAPETTVGTLPGSPSWRTLEPNTVGKATAETSTVARKPISLNRQRRKGVVTDRDSAWEAELDVTSEHLLATLPPTMYSVWIGPRSYQVTAVTATGYTVAASGDLPQYTLIVPTGFRTPANNSPESFKVVGAGSIGTEIKTAGLVAEVIPADGSQNALVEVAGVRGAASDIEIDANGDLKSTVLDFTTLRLQVGQFLGVGNPDDATHRFGTAANSGYVRILTIAAHKITFDKTLTTFVVDNGNLKTIDLFFGRWMRNVAVGHTDYDEQPMCMETQLTDLGGVGTPKYVYARGCLMNEMKLNFPGQAKATMSLALVGMDTDDPTAVRETNASTAMVPIQVQAFSTASDFSRLRVTEVDETGVTSDLKDMTLTFGNNVSPEKTLNNLGARYMNAGTFDVMGEMNCILTDAAVMEAVRDNRLMTMEIGILNSDGGFILDFPSITLGGGVLNFQPDQSVTIPLKIDAVQDTTFGYTMSVSRFPYAPVY